MNLEKKTLKVASGTTTDNNFIKFQINESTKEILIRKEKMNETFFLLELTNKKYKEYNYNFNDISQDVEDSTENQLSLKNRLQDQEKNLDLIVEQMEMYRENEVQCSD